MDTPSSDEVRAQVEHLFDGKYFRGEKLRRLLGFLVEEWLVDGGSNLKEKYIGESLKDEPYTFDEVSGR